jgi:signal transduction histidine kinase
VGTNGDGLKKIVASNKKFKLYSSFNDSSNIAKSIYADKRSIYVGYFNNGLDIFDREKGFTRNSSMIHVPGVALNHVFALASIDSQLLMLNLVGDQFLYTYATASGKITPLSQLLRQILPGFEKKPNINPFLVRQDNVIYAVLYDCLMSFDVSTPAEIKPLSVYEFSGEPLTCCFKDKRGVLWIGSQNGLFYVEGGVKHDKNILKELVQVKTINQDNAGNTWVGTVKGIYVLDRSKKQVASYNEKNGLASQFIYGLLKDTDGDIWFSHNKGLSRYQFASRSFRHYTREDGLQSNEFNTGAYYKSADGALFFGGLNGTNGFYPREIKDNPNIPSTRIISIKLFDTLLKTDTAYWCKQVITLPYNQNSLSFDFVATEFTNPKRNKYTYMMQGIDQRWIEASDKHFARYPALSPGNYIFKVKASNNDGVWQKEPTEVRIIIVPPFWQTLWFRMLLVLLSIGTITGAIIMVQRFRDRKRRRTEELERKIRDERERISRDLHDSVGTQLSLISNNIEWIAYPLKEFTEAERAEKLKYLNLKSREVIATLRESIWALNKEAITIEEFSDKLKAFIQKQLLLYPHITLHYKERIDERLVLGPNEALNLFRICQEGISNSLKYAEASVLQVTIEAEDKYYTIIIADDGKGFETGNSDSLHGHGLGNMNHRAAEINSKLEILSEPGKGTRFIISKK